jgi:hypothetical protein
MNVLLVACLLSQLSYFEFTPIPSPPPQVAGTGFAITIVAKDAGGQIYPFSGQALLTTNLDNVWNYVAPYVIQFNSGVFQGRCSVSVATDSIELRCTAAGASGLSNAFAVIPNSPFRYMTVLPGETLEPGSPNGRYRSPQNQISGDSFLANTYVTDHWFNAITLRNDSISYGGTDPFGIYPAGRLQNGQLTAEIALRRAGYQRLYTRGQSAIRTDTSAQFLVSAGPFSNLLVVLPGETLLAGDTASQAYETPGKTGRPSVLYVKDSTAIRVIGTDRCWNRVLPPSDSIRLLSDFSFHSRPVTLGFVLRDSTLFLGEFDSAGNNQTVWVHDYTQDIESYRCLVDVAQRTESIAILGPDTVRAGAETTYVARLLDANAQPIAARMCYFQVTKGRGRVLESRNISDSSGQTTVQFKCDSANFFEEDSIQFMADGFSKRKGVWIDIGSPEVAAGKVIAYPNPFGFEQPFTTIVYSLPNSSNVTEAIYDPFGNPVLRREIPKGQEGAQSGLNRITWDGRDASGVHKVASGIYVLELRGEEHTGVTFKKTYRIGVVW